MTEALAADDLSAVEAALDQAIAEKRVTPRAEKRAKIERLKPRLLKMREETGAGWKAISQFLKQHGIDVSAETLRLQLDPSAAEQDRTRRADRRRQEPTGATTTTGPTGGQPDTPGTPGVQPDQPEPPGINQHVTGQPGTPERRPERPQRTRTRQGQPGREDGGQKTPTPTPARTSPVMRKF